MRELPWVLLGIRMAPKEDLGRLSAEMVYGALLTVPEDFVPNTANRHSNADPHLRQLWDWVRSFAPVPTSQHGMVPSHIPRNLQEAKYVFVHWEAHCTPPPTTLSRPLQGH